MQFRQTCAAVNSHVHVFISCAATSEIADIQLEYLPPPALQLTADDLPEESWPTPGKPRSPFHGQLSDYLRAVGPGV